MTHYVLANWKAYKSMSEAESWLRQFSQLYTPHPNVEVIVAVPTLYLTSIKQLLDRYKIANLSLAAQDLSSFPSGSYTGTTPAEMLSGLVKYAILGHSERRRYFHETDQDIVDKVREAKVANITPVVCVDQPYIQSQLLALTEKDFDDLIVGYGPVEATGVNTPQSHESVKMAIREIQELVPDKPILYGGSVNRNNAQSCLNISGISGLMAATGSLDPESFVAICESASIE